MLLIHHLLIIQNNFLSYHPPPPPPPPHPPSSSSPYYRKPIISIVPPTLAFQRPDRRLTSLSYSSIYTSSNHLNTLLSIHYTPHRFFKFLLLRLESILYTPA